MSDDFSPELRAELLDDFFAECDEQLASLRVHLLALEQAHAAGKGDPGSLEGVYRNVHSLKGNSAIVGLEPAEHLAHAAEELLRLLSRADIPLSAPELDVLGNVATRLEQIVAAFRLKQPLPKIADLLAQLARYQPGSRIPAPTAPASAPAAEDSAATPSMLPAGTSRWVAIFSPSPELDRRGININAVRQRLSAVGSIVSAVPTIEQGGAMRFEFTLALPKVPADLAAWETDGIVWRAVEPSAAATAPGDATTGAPSSLFIAPSHIVRIDLSRLDELMRIAGEMVIHRSRLEAGLAKIGDRRSELQEVNLAFARSLRDLREAITRVRLVPVAEIFSRLPFVVRDLARESGKKVRLVLEGHETEIDKYLVERLKEPLLHLVRNAVSHGIETSAERAAAGKPGIATILLRVSAAGESASIQIRDDGRGIDAAEVARRAAAAGLAVPEPLDATALLHLLCQPGFSTRDEADRAAGRGVGMAVVASAVRELGGTLGLATSPGQWTQFTLRLPLTLSIAETFIVSVDSQTCAVPQGTIEEIIRIPAADTRRINRVEVAPYRDGLLPLLRLRTFFGAPAAAPRDLTVLVAGSERGLAGLVVDHVRGQREVVVRPLQDPLIRSAGISGATELGDGKPVLILDPAALADGAVRHRATSHFPAPPLTPALS
jgi:two-component system chemotaxis sensor kinase CheA